MISFTGALKVYLAVEPQESGIGERFCFSRRGAEAQGSQFAPLRSRMKRKTKAMN